MANSEFDRLTKEMLAAEGEVNVLFAHIGIARAKLKRIQDERNVIWQKMIADATPKPPSKPVATERRDWHYDSQGYCDNPGRGY